MIDTQVAELASMMDTIELADANGKPLLSGWAIKSIEKLVVDIC